jgi:hypothetical protein
MRLKSGKHRCQEIALYSGSFQEPGPASTAQGGWNMSHFAEPFATRVTEILRDVLSGPLFFRREIIEVPGLLTALLIETRLDVSWEQFLERMVRVKADWKHFERRHIEAVASNPGGMGFSGAEGRTYYAIRGGRHPQQWTAAEGQKFVVPLLLSAYAMQPRLIQWEVENLDSRLPVEPEHFTGFEDFVRRAFNFLFAGHLGHGVPQVRTERSCPD